MKKGYLIFHHNLMFSSIPSSHYKFIVDNIYSKLLDICENGTEFAFEFNGYTLQEISLVSKKYIERLKFLLKQNKCQIIGSSYTQAAFPLIPAKVNYVNLKTGLDIYKEILGVVPDTCLLNEQIYSKSTVSLVKQAGYKNIIFDFLNAFIDIPYPKNYEKRSPIKHNGVGIIWGDSVLTQKFQKAVWEDIDFEDYFNYFEKQQESIVPVYCGDAEVFEYIPGSLNFTKNGKDFENLQMLIEKIKQLKVEIVLPNSLTFNDNLEDFEIATAKFPIKTKKQPKYNITRWAVTGRDSMKMNTQCYSLYEKIKNNNDNKLMKTLCFLWASDFRTNTTDEKYLTFRNTMGMALGKIKATEEKSLPKKAKYNYKLKEKGRFLTVETDKISLTLIKNKGLVIDRLHFKNKHSTACIGTIYQGFFDNIGFAADFYSMHTIVVTKEGRQITDLSAKVEEVQVFSDERGVVVTHSSPINLQNLSIVKEYVLSDTLKVNIKFYFFNLYPLSLRTGIISFLPEFLNEKSFTYATYNGGFEVEEFVVENQTIEHNCSVNALVSATSCLGDTEGNVNFNCGNRKITFKTDKGKCYTVPLLFHKIVDNSHFCRIYYSMCEQDDVSHQFFKGYQQFGMEITL
jgi:hypothetical protein